MFSYLKQKVHSLIAALKAPYADFNKSKRESTSKTFQSIAVAAFIGGVMRLFFDGDSSNNVEVLIWLPCAIMFFHLSILVLPGDEDK